MYDWNIGCVFVPDPMEINTSNNESINVIRQKFLNQMVHL